MEKLQNPRWNCFRQQGDGENWHCHILNCDCHFFKCYTWLLLSHWSEKWELLHVKRFHIFFLRLCVNTIYLGGEKSNNHETFPAMDIFCSNLCSIKRHHYCYQGLCIDYKPLLEKHCSSSLTLTMCATVMKYSGSCVKWSLWDSDKPIPKTNWSN